LTLRQGTNTQEAVSVPIIKSSIKDVRRTARRRERNKLVISRLRTAMAKVRAASNQAEGKTAFAAAQKLLDKAAGKGYIHANKAARTKARLAISLSKLKAA
jgi:small subunit ribosomal protein S20